MRHPPAPKFHFLTIHHHHEITAIDVQTAANLDELNNLWSRAVDSGDSTKLIAEFTARKKALNG